MSSYWWPLGRTVTPPAAPPPTAGPATHDPTLTATPAASSSSTHAATSVADMRHLAQTAFHTSLENLLVEATKHRSLVLLRDAVQDTRQHHYDPLSLFNTLCIACSLLAERCGPGGATRSLSNAGSAAHAAVGGAIEEARKVLHSSGENARLAASAPGLPLAGSFGSTGDAPQHPPLPSSSQALHYRHHGAARNLLQQSIGDVGKLIALGLLPVTLPVGQRVADLVRELAFLPSAVTATTHTPSPRSTASPGATSNRPPTTQSLTRTPPPPPPLPHERDRSGASETAMNTVPVTSVHLVHDDPILVRLLQLTASAASACQLGSPALPELYGVLLLFYSGVAPLSMLEATCEATLTHHIHTVLAELRDNRGSGSEVATSMNHSNSTGGPTAASGAAVIAKALRGGDANAASSAASPSAAGTTAASPFTAQLHGVAFVKDICRLMVGARTRWLHLSLQRSSAQRSGEGAAASFRHAPAVRKANSASSSMAAVTASVVAAAADLERQQQQYCSLHGTPLTTAIASGNGEAFTESLSDLNIALGGRSGGGGGALDSPASLALSASVAAATAETARQASVMEYVPERLRVFLMQAVALFFKEQSRATSSTQPPALSSTGAAAQAVEGGQHAPLSDSPLYVQCLNDCLFSVALWGMYEMDITVPMQPPPPLFVEVMQQQYTASRPSVVCSLELFTCTQQLALVTVSANLASMTNSAQILMEAHERLLQRLYRKRKLRGSSPSPVLGGGAIRNDNVKDGSCVEARDAYAERLSQAAIAVLTLWRKTLTGSSLLWALQQLRSARLGADAAVVAASSDAQDRSSPNMRMGMPSFSSTSVSGCGGAAASFFNERHRQSSSVDSSTGDYASDGDVDSVGRGKRRAAEGHRPPRGGSAEEDVEEEEEEMLSSADGEGEQEDSDHDSADPSNPPRHSVSTSPAARGVRFLHRPQPLTLQRTAAVDAYSDAENSQDDAGGVGSPRLEMAPLARLVISVAKLIMAYMQAAPRASSPSLGRVPNSTGSDEAVAVETAGSTATLSSVTPPAHAAHGLPGDDIAPDVRVSDDTGAGAKESNAAVPKKRRAPRIPVLPFCLGASPPTVYQCLTEAISFLTVFGQYFCQLAERQSDVVGEEALKREQVARRCSSWLLDVHPYLLRCGALCLRCLRYEEDVLPVALKGIGYWVQVSCALQLTEQRDAYLALLVQALQLPDPVVGHLIALSPPSSLTSNSSAGVAAGTTTTATALSPNVATVVLEALLALHDRCAARERIVPGSVAAAALSIGGFRDPSPAGHGHRRGGAAAAASMASWGVGWLRRRRHASGGSGRTTGVAHSRTVSPSQSKVQSGSHTSAAAAAGGTRSEGQEHRPTSSAQPPPLSWRSPAVQHVVVLGVCRLQHKILVMKTLHVIANALGAELDGGLALLSRGTALTEPLLHMLKRLLTWIEETSVEREQQEQLLSDALHLRDALRSLCVNNTCRLSYAQLNVFFAGLVNGTVALSPSAPEAKKAVGIAPSRHSSSAEVDNEEADVGSDVGFPQDELRNTSESASPCTIAYAGLPRHDPQGCADQWVLTSECLCLSLLAMLPFTEQRSGEMNTAAAVPARPNEMNTSSRSNNNSGVSPEGALGAQAVQQQQRQRSGALMRALRLWQLETDMCRYVMDPQRVTHWGITLVTSAAAHRRVLLLTCTGQTRPTQQVLDSLAGTVPFPALSEDETRVMEVTLTTVVDHVAAVAAQLCRSAARRRSAVERDEAAAAVMSGNSATSFAREGPMGGRYPGGAVGPGSSGGVNINSAVALSYQAVQSSALVLTAGPFAGAPLIQVTNTLFATPAGAPSSTAAAAGKDAQSLRNNTSSGSGSRTPLPSSLLPFVQADASLSTAAIVYSLQRAVQTFAMRNTYAAAHHHRDVGSPLTGMVNTTVSSRVSQSGGGVVVSLDPLEQLLASPFALLDDVYQQWSQPQRVFTALKEGSGNQTVRLREDSTAQGAASTTKGASAEATAAGAFSLLQQPGDAQRSIDNSPPTSPVKEAVRTVPETAAAAAVVAEAVPPLLTSAATAVLTAAVKVVQTYGEDIDGAAWEPILSLLQRTAAAFPTLTGQGTTEARTSSGGSGVRGGAKPEGTSSAQAVESLNTAFRALESIQHNHIPRLKVEGLHRLVVCIGAFTVHRVDGGVPGERKLHINLSAVQLLWSTADYLAAFSGENGSGGGHMERQNDASAIIGAGFGYGGEGAADNFELMHDSGDGGGTFSTGHVAAGAAHTPTSQQDRLWCSLLWQLRNGCLDDRQEIRQSAMQTLFALVQNYGWRFSWTCWRCVLHDVLLPLIEVVAAATVLCATPASADGPAVINMASGPTSTPVTSTAAAASTTTAITQDAVVQLLLKAFTEQPAQLEEVRVTLYDAGSRLFVTHYANMQAALRSSLPSSAGVGNDEADHLAYATAPAGVSTTFQAGNTGDTGEATRVLEAFLRLCGDVCVVVRGTSGEPSAMAAVHALHGLLVELPGDGLYPLGVHLAWCALERLLYRGDEPGDRVGRPPPQHHHTPAEAPSSSSSSFPSPSPFAHTETKQCTLAVVAAIVAALCDSFRMQRMMAAPVATASAAAADMREESDPKYSGNPQALAATDRSPGGYSGGGLADRVSSYISGMGSKFSKSGTNTSRSARTSPDAQRSSSQAQYFTRLLFVLQAVTRCNAVVSSYYFPSKPQTTLLEGVIAVWPTLTSREARMLWGEVLLPAFPAAEDLQRFVLQDVTTATKETAGNNHNTTSPDAPSTSVTTTIAAAASRPPPLRVTLKTMMPPGSHPSYLSAVMDTMRQLLLLHMGIVPTSPNAAPAIEEAAAAAAATTTSTAGAVEDRTRLLFMAPSTVDVAGTLLLLHLASPAVLAGPPRAGSGGVLFTLPPMFLQECTDLLQFTLWGPVLSRAPVTEREHDGVPSSSSSSGGGAGGLGLGLGLDTRRTASPEVDGSLPAAARCRREGVEALCRVFERFLAATSTVVRFLDASSSRVSPRVSAAATPLPQSPPPPQQPSSSVSSSSTATPAPASNATVTITTTTVPQHVTASLQSLDSLVDTLGEVVRVVMEQHEDVEAATEAITALSLASTAEGLALARVAKRSLALLQRWADAVVGAASPASARHRSDSVDSASFPASHRAADGAALPVGHPLEGLASRSQLQDVARASMETRNRAIMKQYGENPDDASVSALLIDTLRDMLRVAQKDVGTAEDDRHEAYSLEQWDGVMPELLQLVACCSKEPTRSAGAMTREKEVRETLSSILAVLHERRRQRGRSPCTTARRSSNNINSSSSQVTSHASMVPQQQLKRTTATKSEEAMSII
ncbi:hypothetical protein ABB37_06915 [Leptomonas pyrrhocoris]|uniref:Mon2 C-terminal domain-containing protein n=1 Tax=Leptomonas pyrrhocoris TaxID=157538 RepID=A0A0M9FWV2_LEPPY|nr:hypothetical protein ABB37_06915 [Leptomonas pyrrhocoris]KPA77536.1 hypothetical protein ABB37_06915 [Leptomonas pyrrhocoris]|eukprot:XP_015655975.1 hypothetical protein ABB37_06915 [Leptomonas pyrrhocoris]